MTLRLIYVFLLLSKTERRRQRLTTTGNGGTSGVREEPLDAMTYERWPVRREYKESVRVRSHPVSCGCTGVGAGAGTEVDAFGRMYVNLSIVQGSTGVWTFFISY
jgi:hypothetical protein